MLIRPCCSFAITLAVTAAILLPGCASMQPHQRPPLDPQPLLRFQTPDEQVAKLAEAAIERQVKAYYTALEAAENAPSDSVKLHAYRDSGIALVNSFCRGWFAQLDDYARNLSRTRSHHGILTSLGTALIGVAKLHADVTAVYGALNTAYTGALDSAAKNYLFSASSATVENKVFAHLNQRAALMRGRTYSDFGQVRNALEDYDRICTFKHAHALVEKSVEAARTTVDKDGSILISFGMDDASAAFRRERMPGGTGTTINAEFEEFAKQWLKREGINVSLTGFQYGAEYASARRELLAEFAQSQKGSEQ